jgi:hypothetical protein
MNTLILRNRFPYVVAAVLGAAVVIGFLRTYYLRFLSGLPPMSVLVHVHGLLCTAWLILHLTQARLVSARRVAVHTRLGVFTAMVGLAIVVTGAMVSVAAAARGHTPGGRDPLEFLSVPLGATFMFALFLGAALWLRRRSEWHKRLMLLTTMVFLGPAIGRLDGLAAQHWGWPNNYLPFAVTLLFLAWGCVNDLRKRGRIHPAYLVGGTAILAAFPLRIWLGKTDAWMTFATWAVDSWPVG